jgi:sortase A
MVIFGPYFLTLLKPLPNYRPASVELLGPTFPADWLSVPSLGISVPVIYIEEKNESAYQAALEKGVVHYPGTALPGKAGNVYIFGHSSDFVWSAGSYKTIFARLPDIRVGSEILITNSQGDEFTYLVTGTKVVSPKDLSVLDQNNFERQLLTLQTSYPLGTALQRYIVVAELDSHE